MDTQKYIPFLIVSATIFIVLDLYFVLSLDKYFKNSGFNIWFGRTLWAIATLIAISTGYTLWLRSTNQIPSLFEKFLFTLPAIWYLPKAVISPVLMAKDLIRFISGFFRKKQIQKSEPISEKAESRRKFIQGIGWSLSLVPFLGVANGCLRTTTAIRIKAVSIPIKDLPVNLEGLKIVQLTDIHAGSFSSPKMMQELVWMIRMIQPDLIFLTGDLVNFNPKELPLILPQLKSLDAKCGVFGCFGNHDHYMIPAEHIELLKTLEDAGIEMLINSNVKLEINNEILQIAGVDNTSYRQSYGDFDKALSGLSTAYPTILICHDPTNWDKEVRRKRKVDLMLSGHTHGGQIAIELFGETFTPARYFYKQYAGLYSSGDQNLYISAGIGTVGPPIRIGVNPELTYITLKSQERFS